VDFEKIASLRTEGKMVHSLRSRLLRGDLLVGTLLTLSSNEVMEILAGVGFDWLFIDLEHSPMDAQAAQTLLQAAGGRVDCILRVPLNDEIWIKKALDTGVAGVMIPQVNTAEEALRGVRFCKYPPQGGRSVGLARAQGYGASLQEYLATANEMTAVIIQVEHISAVQNIEKILAVDGVDAVLIGPYDLSASMGLGGKVEHPEVQTAVARVRETCLAHGKTVGIYTGSAESARELIQAGYRLLALSTDTLLLRQAAADMIRKVK
jgi:2-dehydro-3-deoxyglucarate aldolase